MPPLSEHLVAYQLRKLGLRTNSQHQRWSTHIFSLKYLIHLIPYPWSFDTTINRKVFIKFPSCSDPRVHTKLSNPTKVFHYQNVATPIERQVQITCLCQVLACAVDWYNCDDVIVWLAPSMMYDIRLVCCGCFPVRVAMQARYSESRSRMRV